MPITWYFSINPSSPSYTFIPLYLLCKTTNPHPLIACSLIQQIFIESLLRTSLPQALGTKGWIRWTWWTWFLSSVASIQVGDPDNKQMKKLQVPIAALSQTYVRGRKKYFWMEGSSLRQWLWNLDWRIKRSHLLQEPGRKKCRCKGHETRQT